MNAKDIYLIAGGIPGGVSQIAENFRVSLAACGKAKPKVAYVGAANSDNAVFYQGMKLALMGAGAGTVEQVRLAQKNADAESAKRILSDADAVFLSGGEVEDGIAWLEKADLIGFLTELYRGGILFFGVSAGAIMLGRHWVHWDVEGDDGTSRLFDCLGFAPFVFDAHGEKEDWTELKCALRLLGPGAVGHGLSAGGFYSVDEGGRFTTLRNEPALFRNADGSIVRINYT